MDFISVPELVELLEVVLVNLVLSADNAIVVGIAVAGLPVNQRLKVMVLGIAAATGLRIIFALFTVQLLEVTGLLLAGGLLLLWVCWKLWSELRSGRLLDTAAGAGANAGERKTMRAAVTEIIVADVSMSLDNVLAVAGVAREHAGILAFGLILSVVFMGMAAAVIAKLLNRHQWIAYVGLAVIVYVAARMIWDGGFEVAHAL